MEMPIPVGVQQNKFQYSADSHNLSFGVSDCKKLFLCNLWFISKFITKNLVNGLQKTQISLSKQIVFLRREVLCKGDGIIQKNMVKKRKKSFRDALSDTLQIKFTM
ncbi:hypothetical protein P5673_025239 [Acropora cervicornis]|uniref:Uncharacterized protein n=1 Tax=Acropora cervicornis TaxID=6130 RepID=A0AAD9Q2C0_ACRCE|nr:hypothetical protein P5673_025239 [Acropora cervicornis]